MKTPETYLVEAKEKAAQDAGYSDWYQLDCLDLSEQEQDVLKYHVLEIAVSLALKSQAEDAEKEKEFWRASCMESDHTVYELAEQLEQLKVELTKANEKIIILREQLEFAERDK